MKLRTIIATAAACVLAFASCTKDGQTAKSIEGAYEGIQEVSMTKHGGDEPTPVSFVVSDYKNGTCTVEIPANHELILTGVKVTESNGVFTLRHEAYETVDYKLEKGFDAVIKGDEFTTSYHMFLLGKPMCDVAPKGMDYTFKGIRK